MNFKAPYNLDDYVDFFQSYFLPEDFESCKEKTEINFQTHFIENITKLGEVPSLDLSVYEAKHQSENDPRVSLSRDSFRFLAQYGVKRALILFISKNSSNYRLSFVTIDLKWEEGKRVKKEYSNPRRYSFFLGPDTKTHTPEEYLIKLGRVRDFNDLKNRFSIEVVNKEFYTQIAILFTKLAGGKRTIGREQYDEKGVLKLPSTNDDTIKKEFSVRFIGRLVFCWFLEKKRSENGVSLLPKELLSSGAVSKNKGFYHKILEPLFFGVLNTPISDRRKEYRNGSWSQIPFLNGGLFTPHLHDFFDPGPLGMSKHINTLKIPDEWIIELFEIFETYNFTIDENTSMDVELAIEPEMLGRIFENLLAEINPETGETARKATGSYYTPRPIVEYMVDESLKQYLLTTTKLNENKISFLLAYEKAQVDLTDSERNSVLDALDKIKIIDPACGSGAFPMGILQKMLLILQKIDPESKQWLSKKIAQIDNKLLKKELEKKLKLENWNYVHKLGIIQSSIYGVDIQPVAVDIAKLRFFLSLIVDEKVDDAKENRGIEPLPNLEFKFVCADSLIGLPKKEAQQTMFEATNDIDLLKNLRDEYLRSYGKEKEIIEKKFKETQSRMFRHGLTWGGKDSQTLKLSQWDPFSFASCGWFDPDWMFGIKEGFDVVIENPPYIRVDDLEPSDRDKYRSLYKTAVGKYDLYYLFFERSFSLCNKKGICVFISPNKFCAADSAEDLRQLLFKFSNSGEILSTSMLKVFEAAANYPVISILNTYSPQNDLFVVRQAISLDLLTEKNPINCYIANIATFKKLPSSIIPINISQDTFNLIVKLYKKPLLLSQFLSISEGLRIPSKLESESKKEIEIVKQYQFSKFSSIESGSYLTNSNFKKVLSESSDRYKKIVSEKILIAEDALEISATLDLKKRVPQGGVYFAVITKTHIHLKYILGLLNSKLLSFIYEALYSGMHMGGGYLRYRSKFLESLPIPYSLLNISSGEQSKVVEIVDEILAITKNKNINKDTTKKALEKNTKKIDQLIYAIYELTGKEKNLVENLKK